MLDALLAAEELPEEYRDRCQVHLPLQLISPVLCILVKVIITQHLFLVKQENISIIVYRAISFLLLLSIQKTKRIRFRFVWVPRIMCSYAIHTNLKSLLLFLCRISHKRASFPVKFLFSMKEEMGFS